MEGAQVPSFFQSGSQGCSVSELEHAIEKQNITSALETAILVGDLIVKQHERHIKGISNAASAVFRPLPRSVQPKAVDAGAEGTEGTEVLEAPAPTAATMTEVFPEAVPRAWASIDIQ